MILRRITEHVKAQNWTAVALDFVIVVVGVFIGIQVSNWNATEDQKQRQQVALADLFTESQAIIAIIEGEVSREANNIARARPVVAAISAQDREGLTSEQIVSALANARQFRAISTPRVVYDSLTSAGVLNGISETPAIRAVSRFYSTGENVQNATELFQYFIIEEFPKFGEYAGVEVAYNDRGSFLRQYTVDVDTFINNEAAREDAVHLLRNMVAFQSIRLNYLQSAVDMCVSLGEALGQECSNTPTIREEEAP
ncbi:MAG: hypothetical protein AAFY84_00820 [Pseudomonadota bacterium]